ncbi:hypothetical protein CO675_15780 [Bradyrhizobium sp. C9]|nr:hypothetical protein CO675_15780 [Bradyrhizobium sp. C9]
MSPIDEPIVRRLQSAVTAVICLLSPETAQAETFNRACTSVPRHLWLSLQALETKVESQGYKIEKGRLTSTCAAFESLNADNARVELFVDPTNGEIKGTVKLARRQRDLNGRP